MERAQIKNIIMRMNLKEKISQLCSIPSIEVRMDGSEDVYKRQVVGHETFEDVRVIRD